MTHDTDLFGQAVEPLVVHRWTPSCYYHPILGPHGKETPNSWLQTLPDGRRALLAPDADDSDQPTALRHGDCVPFHQAAIYRQIQLTIRPGGSAVWVASPSPDRRARHFSLWGTHCFQAETLDALAKQLMAEAAIAGPGPFDIVCTSSNDDVPFFFSEKTGNFETGLAEAPAAGAA